MRRAAAAIVVVAALAAAGLLGSHLYVERSALPVDLADASAVEIFIPPGSATPDIAGILGENGLIRNETVFRLLSKRLGKDGKYKAGSYSLDRSMSMRQIISALSSPEGGAAQRFTIPEGYTLAQTADRLAGDGLSDAGSFLEEARTGDFGGYAFLEGIPPSANRLEGFLYPETYEVYKNASPHDIIDRMLSQFDLLFTEEYYGKAAEMGLSVLDVVTIASLIESETKVADERALVSSVIHNRLREGMKLQIDATVQYALGEHKDRLLYSDLEIDSPYNTYKAEGLPPGPICSPRIECVEAALYPADTDYLYYVLRPELDGRHSFTGSYDEFLRFKSQYQAAL